MSSLYTVAYDIIDKTHGGLCHSGTTTVRAVDDQMADEETTSWVLAHDYVAAQHPAPKVRITSRVLIAA